MANNNSSRHLHLKLPLTTRIKLYIWTFARWLSTGRDGTVNRRILSLIDTKASAPATKRINPSTTVSTSDITVDGSRNLWFRLFVPSSNKPMPLIVYFHGGGFTTYGPDSKCFNDLCCSLAAEVPAVIASINYRLAPEHRYPAQYYDGFDALKFIDQQNYAILPANTDMKNCFIAGDSAGGNIAHHVTFKSCQKSDEFKKIKIAGVLGFQPFFGGEERTESELRLHFWYLLNVERSDWMWRSFLPGGANRNHPAAHVFGSTATTEELKRVEFPRALIVVGGYDPLQDWQKMYIQWLVDCEKEVEVIDYPNGFHGFYGFPEVPERDLLINDAAKFIRKRARL